MTQVTRFVAPASIPDEWGDLARDRNRNELEPAERDQLLLLKLGCFLREQSIYLVSQEIAYSVGPFPYVPD